jgi:NIMA (never in mitosis gene a)-related kinase
MEYANEGDLCRIINEAKERRYRISESLIWKIIINLTEGINLFHLGLNYLHKNNILHRDIKPANIFKSDGIFKLGDLNVSRILSPGVLAKTQIGSPLYTSP